MHSTMSHSGYMMALYYIEIFTSKINSRPRSLPFHLSKNCAHRVILIACMIASKQLDDFYLANKVWAQIGGIELRSLNRLEAEFLETIEYRTHISAEQYK